MTTNIPRTPAGVPTGGQFACRARSDAEITLAGADLDFLDENQRDRIAAEGSVTIDSASPVPPAAVFDGATRIRLARTRQGGFVATAEFDRVNLLAAIDEVRLAGINQEEWLAEYATAIDEFLGDNRVSRVDDSWSGLRLSVTVDVTDPGDSLVSFTQAASAFELDESATELRDSIRNPEDGLFDELRQHLRAVTCRECGGRNDNDGDGWDGLCATCADRASCPECGGELEDGQDICDDCAEDDD